MKKTLALFIAIAMLLAFAAGCGGTTEKPADSPASEAPATEAPAAPAEEPGTEPEAPAEEPGGVTYPLSEETVELELWYGGSGDTIAAMSDKLWNDNEATKQVVENTGVYVNYVAYEMDQYIQMMNIMIASAEYPDIIALATIFYPGGIDALIEEEVCINIDPLLPEYAPDYWALCEQYPDFYKATKSDSGNVIGMYGMSPAGVTLEGSTIRKDMLDAVGMDVPTTYDELHDALTAIKTEFNTKNTWMGAWTLAGTYDSFSGGYDVCVDRTPGELNYQVNDAGEVQLSATLPQWKAYVQMLRTWYEEGLLTDECLSVNNARDIQGNILNDEVAFAVGGGTNYLANSLKAQAENPDFEMVGVPELMSEEWNPDGIFKLRSSGGEAMFDYSITTDCEYPEIAVSYMNYFFTDKGSEYVSFGAEGVTFNYGEDGSHEFTDFILNNPDGLSQSTALNANICVGPTCVSVESKLASLDSQAQFDAVEIWSANRNASHRYYGSLTSEESARVSTIESDICTLVNETMGRLVFGSGDFESEYNDFIEKINSFGVEELLEAKQAAYDRYLVR